MRTSLRQAAGPMADRAHREQVRRVCWAAALPGAGKGPDSHVSEWAPNGGAAPRVAGGKLLRHRLLEA